MNQTAIAIRPESATEERTVSGCGGVIPPRQKKHNKIVNWKVERGARRNYRLLGRRLAEASDRLYRNRADGQGLIQVSSNGDSGWSATTRRMSEWKFPMSGC